MLWFWVMKTVFEFKSSRAWSSPVECIVDKVTKIKITIEEMMASDQQQKQPKLVFS